MDKPAKVSEMIARCFEGILGGVWAGVCAEILGKINSEKEYRHIKVRFLNTI